MRIVLMSIIFGLLIAGLSLSLDPEKVEDGHVWLFDNGSAEDVTKNNLDGSIQGDPKQVKGLYGDALRFNGSNDGVIIPDSDFINITNGPWPNRTVIAVFNCADVSKAEMQTVFEEGGRTRGLTIYVHEGKVYAGGWNRAEYDWNPGSWISASIKSNTWHSVALIIRDGGEGVEDNKFEMWMDGQLIGAAPGGHIYNHSNDNAIGYTKENNVFHDDTGEGDGWYFEGLIDEVWILNQAPSPGELSAITTSVEPADKLTTSWGAIKD